MIASSYRMGANGMDLDDWCIIGNPSKAREPSSDVIRKYTKEKQVKREEAQDQKMWRMKTQCADPKYGKGRRRRDLKLMITDMAVCMAAYCKFRCSNLPGLSLLMEEKQYHILVDAYIIVNPERGIRTLPVKPFCPRLFT